MQCAVCIWRDFMDHGLGLGSGAVSLQYSFTVRKWCLCLGKTSICFKAGYHGLLLLNVDFQNLIVLYNTCFLVWGMSSHRTYNATGYSILLPDIDYWTAIGLDSDMGLVVRSVAKMWATWQDLGLWWNLTNHCVFSRLHLKNCRVLISLLAVVMALSECLIFVAEICKFQFFLDASFL